VVGFNAIGAAAGFPPTVTVTRAVGTVLAQFTAYHPAFTGGVSATTAEIDGDLNTVEVVTGPGFGGGPHVRVFRVDKVTGAVGVLAEFMAYAPTFLGGVNVATGRVGNLATDAIVTGAGPGGGPHVRTFTVTTGGVQQLPGPLGSFLAYGAAFRGGVAVAVANVNGNPLDGDEVVTGAGPGGGPHVRVFGVGGSVFSEFLAFDPGSRTGIAVGPFLNGQLTVSALQGGEVGRFVFLSDGTAIRAF
jgi:hypothetical protein